MILKKSHFREELQHMVAEVKRRVYHTYAEQFVTYPQMDLFQMHFIYLFLRDQGSSAHQREIYCVCQTLIQLGLDSHENVGIEDLKQKESVRNRQLTILSGDYFSVYYYYYLAEKKQANLIRGFSEVMKAVNECKTELHHQKAFLTTDEQIELRVKARRIMIDTILSWFEAPSLWYDINVLFLRAIFYSRQDPLNKHKIETILLELDHKLQGLPEQFRCEFGLWLEQIRTEQLVPKS